MAENVNNTGAAEAAPLNPCITEIDIHHVRHLHGIEIPLSKIEKKNLVLTGENGSGKTSLLDVLYHTLGKKCMGLSYSETAVRTVLSHENTELAELYKRNQFILAKFDDERRMEEPIRSADSEKTLSKELTQRLNSGKNPFIIARANNEGMDNPVATGETADMLLQKWTQWRQRIESTSEESQNAVDSDESEKDIEQDKFRVLYYPEGEWFYKIRTVLRKLYHDDSLELIPAKKTSEIEIHAKDREPFSFDTMASGFSAVLDIIADLFIKMEGAGSYDFPGIVLIDEIEVHLHVSLQKKIFPILTELFPNLQFIVSTHSPFVLASAENAVVYDLEHKVLIKDGLFNNSYSGIVEGYFQVSELSDKLEGDLEAYRALAEKKEWTDREYAEAARLERELGGVPDFLSSSWKAEFDRLKLEIEADKGE